MNAAHLALPGLCNGRLPRLMGFHRNFVSLFHRQLLHHLYARHPQTTALMSCFRRSRKHICTAIVCYDTEVSRSANGPAKPSTMAGINNDIENTIFTLLKATDERIFLQVRHDIAIAFTCNTTGFPPGRIFYSSNIHPENKHVGCTMEPRSKSPW